MSHTNPSSSRCAACKCLRRRCAPNCILAPHFPSNSPQRFATVHKVFGAANITKMLEQVPVNLRGQAAESLIFEAETRVRDPVYGSVGIISQLQQQIAQVQNEIVKIQGEVALRSAHQLHLGARDYSGPVIGPDIGPGLASRNMGEEFVSGSSQRNDLDDYLYTTLD